MKNRIYALIFLERTMNVFIVKRTDVILGSVLQNSLLKTLQQPDDILGKVIIKLMPYAYHDIQLGSQSNQPQLSL